VDAEEEAVVRPLELPIEDVDDPRRLAGDQSDR
jgi:hypothetical protein